MAEDQQAPPRRTRHKILWGLRAKVILTFLIPALLTVSLLVWFSSFRLRESLDAQLGQRLSNIAQAAVPQLPFESLNPIYPEYHTSRTYRNLRRKMLQLQTSTKVRRIYVFDRKRKSLMDTRKTSVGTAYVSLSFEQMELDAVFRGKSRASVLFLDKKGTYYKTGFAPLFDGKKVVAAVAVEGSAAYFKNLRDTEQELLLYGLLSLLLVIVAGGLFARWLAAPVRQLVEVAQAIGEGRMTDPVPTLGKDEIGFLAETMEEMRQNILARDGQMQMMLSGIAHEVRNPLGGMELFSGILIDELADDDEKRGYVERIQRETRYLGNVVTSFLDFARPTQLDLRAHDWKEFCFELYMLLTSDLEPRGIELKLEHPDDLPPIYFDKSTLHQTMLNLLQNAIQASPDDSEIKLVGELDGEDLKISIIDKGKGIPAETAAKIFEPFYTTKEKGTGLGLPLAKKFIDLHRGRVTLESEEGEGTTITIWLPRGESSANVADEPGFL